LTVRIKKRVDALIPHDPVVSQALDTEVTSVYIFNFVNDIDLDDEAELLEVVSNLRELLKCIGDIGSAKIMLSPGNLQAHAEVTFADLGTAQKAVAVVEGLVCGGQQLHASLTYSAYTKKQTFKATPVQETDTPALASPSAVLTLYNMVSGENTADEEETQEVLHDVQELCAVFGDVQRVWIEQRETVQSSASTFPTPDFTDNVSSVAEYIVTNLPWAVVHYSNIQECIASRHNLSTQVVAGSNLIAHFYDMSAHQQQVFQDRHVIREECNDDGSEKDQYALRLIAFVSTEELEGEEERTEVMDNIDALVDAQSNASIRFVSCSPSSNAPSPVVDVLIIVSNLSDCVSLFERVKKQIIGGEQVHADILHIVSTTAESILGVTTSDEVLTYHKQGYECTLLHTNGTVVAEVRQLCDTEGTAALVVQDYFTPDDLESDCESDLVEMKKDLLRLAKQDVHPQEGATSHLLNDSYVQSVRIVRKIDAGVQSDSSTAILNTFPSDSSSMIHYVACVAFAQPSQAEDAMLHLDERIIGGAELRAARDSLGASFCARKTVAELTIAPEEERPDVVPTSTTLGDENELTTAPAELLCLFSIEYISTPENNCELVGPNAADEDGQGNRSGVAICEGKNVVSKYVEAQALPKLPVHSAPRLPIPVRKSTSRAIQSMCFCMSMSFGYHATSCYFRC